MNYELFCGLLNTMFDAFDLGGSFDQGRFLCYNNDI